MPCGGIYPVRNHWSRDSIGPRTCWYNDGDDSELFVEEWDTFLHVKCLLRFLGDEEGHCLLSHGHEICVPMDLWTKK